MADPFYFDDDPEDDGRSRLPAKRRSYYDEPERRRSTRRSSLGPSARRPSLRSTQRPEVPARVGNAVTWRPKCPQFLPNFSRCPHSRFVPGPGHDGPVKSLTTQASLASCFAQAGGQC